MANFTVLSCGVILSLLLKLVCGNVPVLIWESSIRDRTNYFPALQRISSEEFQQYMLKKVHGEKPDPLLALFMDESLSVEDFRWKDSKGQGYFPQLKYITETAANIEFLPSVQNPIEAVAGLHQFGYSVQSINDSDSNTEIPEGCGKVLLIKLKEAESDEDRPELLRQHDNKINEIYSELLSKCSHVIGVYTSSASSWVEPEEVIRIRRSADNSTVVPDEESYTLFQDSSQFSLLFSKSHPKLTHEGKEVSLENRTITVSGDRSKPTDIKLFVKYGSEHKLTFYFDNKTSGYWTLRSVDYEEQSQPAIVLKSSLEIQAPEGFSYHCGTPVVFRNRSTNTALTFSDLQVQPFFINPGSKSFGEAIDEVGFFTPAIWSGIFVTFLLALIFTWGISMIMDIRTMDQFDDPKGKTITVSATD